MVACALETHECPAECKVKTPPSIKDLFSFYPGCDTPDIMVENYTIAACNVGASKAVQGSIDTSK
jgi:hypothetical protein